MWKKLVLLGGLVACLGLPAFAAAGTDTTAVVRKTIPVELKGKLQKHLAYPEDGWRCMMAPIQRDPVVFWTLLVDGTTYDLDLDNRHDLWVLADQSVGQTVLVKGTWDGDVLHVASLKADVAHVKKTVQVEVKGRLQVIYPPIPEVPVQEPGQLPEPFDFGPYWQLCVNDKVYTLVFDEGAEGLVPRAQELNGRSVILTGVLDGETIHVASLRADDEYLKVTGTTVEVKGKLQYVITLWDTGEVVMVTDELPEDLSRCWSINLGMVIDGQTYVLNFADNGKSRERAEQFVGATVLIDGTLDGGQVKVGSLSRESGT